MKNRILSRFIDICFLSIIGISYFFFSIDVFSNIDKGKIVVIVLLLVLFNHFVIIASFKKTIGQVLLKIRFNFTKGGSVKLKMILRYVYELLTVISVVGLIYIFVQYCKREEFWYDKLLGIEVSSD